MQKVKAYWLRFWHCLWHTLKLRLGHRMVTISNNITIPCGFVWRKENNFKRETERMTIWSSTTYIGCECGKCWYDAVPKTNKLIRDIIDGKTEN